MPTLARLLFFLAALSVFEGHLLIGQTVAWLTMIHDRAPAMGLQGAVADTFSGANPCEICLAIQDEREKKEEEAPVPEANPLAKAAPVLFPRQVLRIFPPSRARPEHPRSERGRDLWHSEVPSPPPWLG